MDQHHQQPSRPPSVDSVNLGSIYSGFYPQASSTGPSSLNTVIGHHHQQQQQFPSYHQQAYQQQYQPQYQSLPVAGTYGGYPPAVPPANYHQPNVIATPATLPLNINQHYQISAAAAAATAFGMSFQQQQPNSNIQSPPHQPAPSAGGPTMNYGLQPPTWPLSPPQYGPTKEVAGVGGTNNDDYIKQYYSQYYREYYQRYVVHQKRMQQEQNQKKIAPFKYNRFHTPAIFSQHDNRLMVGEPNARLAVYGLQEVFTEQCYPQLFLQSLLFDREPTPGGDPPTMLPFDDAQVALDWIRIKQLNDSGINYELKLILKVITMLFRQNGSLSGLDLSELLYELVTNAAGDDSVEKLSNSGSEAITKDYYREMLAHLRQLLMRGQRRVAITYAQNNGLFDHAMALAYLLSFLPAANGTSGPTSIGSLGHVIDNGLMISTIRKFVATTLSHEDPLFVFYSHLLQVATNVVNAVTAESGSTPAATPAQSSAKIDRLESFIILLANDIKFDRVEIADKSYRNLIDLMIALLKEDYNYVLPDELFNNDRFDALLVNECLEFARFHGSRLNPRLMLRKLEFAFELFEFGFSRHALNYITRIKEKILDPDLDWKLLVDPKSRYRKYLLPESAVNSDPEDEATHRKLLQSIWLYQMAKIFTRVNVVKDFHSPLFDRPEPEEEKDSAGADEDETDTKNKNEEMEEEDKTDMLDDIEEEEAELTSESSVSNRQDQSSSASQPPLEQQQSASQQQLQNSTMVHSSSTDGPITPVMDKSMVNSINSMSPIENHANLMGPRRSLPAVPNNFGRALNPIMEVPGSLESNNHTEGDETTTSFKMNQMNNALPPPPHREENSLGAQALLSQPQPFQPMLFQPPPPPMMDQNSAAAPPPFDFVSSGRVSSIPVYDPFMAKEVDGMTPTATADVPQINHKNNEFLLNSGHNQSFSNENNSNHQHQDNNRKQETTEKSSPSKGQGGGLLNAILGRLKPKNQMILPDDSDPQIIYDPVTKRWIDKSSGNQQDGPAAPPPPPRIPLAGGTSQSEPNSAVTSPAHRLPTMPTFSSGLNSMNPITTPPVPSVTDPAPQTNGSVPNVANSFGVQPPLVAGGNNFRTDIRRKRYIDVFNQTR